MTFDGWVFRRWIFRSFYPEYPTTRIPNFSVGFSRRWVFLMSGIPANPGQNATNQTRTKCHRTKFHKTKTGQNATE